MHLAAVTLQENITYWFQCRADGWNTSGPLLLTWYLNGDQQGVSPERCLLEAARPATRCNSSFSLQASRWQRQLTCVASHPRTGEKFNTTVVLDVRGGLTGTHFKEKWAFPKWSSGSYFSGVIAFILIKSEH